MAQVRPALTVDVNAAQHSARRAGPSSKAIATHTAASAHAPAPATTAQQQSTNQTDRRSAGGIRPGDIISEDDLAAQGGFSSDEEGDDVFNIASRQTNAMGDEIDIVDPARQQSRRYANGVNQEFDDSEDSEAENYGPDGDGEMMSDEDDGVYDDEDEEELSSSPSIPDENIDFDLVYALHNFVATVEGQATVNKGNSLTLLDDSNSYWWLVRVLRTQEVGYIPAENIETPYERLARLNKHRNVDLTSATDDDHIQVPENIITSHLVKQRSFGNKGVSLHSGKLSALSRRNHGPPSRLADIDEGKYGVQFGPPTYLEHSGNEYSDEDEEDDEYDDENDMIEMEEDEEEEEGDAAEGDEAGQEAAGALHGQQQHGSAGARQMEPDDGMDWDGRESERVQRAQEERNAARQAAEQRMSNDAGSRQSNDDLQGRHPVQQQQQQQQQQPQQQLTQAPASRQQLSQQLSQQQQHAQTQALHHQQQQQQQQQQQMQAATSNEHTLNPRAQQSRSTQPVQNRNSDRLSTSTLSSTGSSTGFLPSQLQAARENASSDVSGSSPDAKRDKRSSHRKSRGEDEGASDEKQGKKRSGVFSGLFSRSKDKKERKSGHFSQSSMDSDAMRTSEDSSRLSGAYNSTGSQYVGGAGRTVQERDRAQQEAYQRQFLSDNRTEGRPARPGSLIATPGSVPMLNVLRVFAGDDLESSATFKTVLLNQSTSAEELLKQAIQRFRIHTHGLNLDDFYLTIKLVEGDERLLERNERPLQVFDQLTEALNASNQNASNAIPSVKRSSVGSISSISSNLSLNPAIARLENDFSDDHHVKFYLHRRPQQSANTSYSSQGQSFNNTLNGNDYAYNTSNSQSTSSPGAGLQTLAPGAVSPAAGQSADESYGSMQSMRFPLRLLIFPSDLPDGLVFDPQTNALVPQKALQARGPAGQTASEGIPHEYREKILALPRNTTVAEVIEQGLERFGIVDGVVEGGDDVEDRSSRRRSKPRFRYGLCIKSGEGERPLQPSSKVLDAFPVHPVMRAAQTNRRSKRSSTDSAMLLNMAEELRTDDPVFILRQVQRHHRTSRPLSPTDNLLASKQDERRHAELDSVAPAPSSRALDEVRGGAAPAQMEQQGMSRQEIIAAQRAAARERRAAVLGLQPNEENGVDVMLEDRSRLRSSKVPDTGKVRYSFIPSTGEEHDISAIVEDVLQTENAAMNGLLSAPRPSLHASRSASATTVEDYVSAPGSPLRATPLSLSEVNASFAPSTESDGDALERLMRDGSSSSVTVEDRIEQVLSRLAGGGKGALQPQKQSQSQQQTAQRSTAAAAGALATSKHAPGGSISSSHETASPISGNTHPSGTTTPTPLSMLAVGGGGAAVGAGLTALSTVNGDGARPLNGSLSRDAGAAAMGGGLAGTRVSNAKAGTSAPLAISDYGIAHLYAVSEAAARKKPPRKRPSKSIIYSAPPVLQQHGAAVEDDLHTTLGGLFPPLAPYIEDRKIKDAYGPIGRQLNGLEDTLDRLLNDALRLE